MKPENHPPKYFDRFFRWFCHSDFYEDLRGDLEETFYENVEEKNLKYARKKFRKEVLMLFRPSVIKELRFSFLHQISPDMFQNYFKIAIRNLYKDKVSAFINIFGLCIGFACNLFIILFVLYEVNVDSFFENKEKIYRVTYDERPFRETGRYMATTSPPFAPTITAEYGEVENAVRLRYTDDVIFNYEDLQFYENNVVYADKDFFKLFSFPLKHGTPSTVLAAPNSIVLTPNAAQKYFGAENPVGKSIVMNEEVVLQVTGVLKDTPQKTHLDFDFLISFETFKVPFGYPVTLESWGWISFHTYLLLKPGTNIETFNTKLNEFAKRHIYADREVSAAFGLQALEDIYFKSNDMMNTGETKKGSLTYTYGLSFIAFLILLIAGFNFMNISTARSIKRAKEVGVRKVLGARKQNLITQFIGETLINSLISLVLALILFELFRNGLLHYLEWDLGFDYRDYWMLLPILLGLTILLGILAAIYPAIILSNFKPSTVLKGVIRRNSSEMNIRKVLVIFQFAITVGLIISSLVVSRQMEFIQNKNLGYDKEQLIYLQMRSDDFLQRYGVAKKILGQNPNVLSITAGDAMDGDYGSVPMTPAGAEQGIAMNMMGGYLDYFTTLGIDFVAGRDFSAQHPIDTATGIIINEAALRTFGWEEPLGQKLQVNSNINGEIIGVVKDFHFQSLHDPIEPIVIVVPRTHMRNIILRVNPIEDVNKLISSLQNDWQQIAPDLPFEFAFLDDNLNLQYEADQRFSKLVKFFGWLAIIIAGLGLYGLIVIITTYKVKEIGIRKVLGASTYSISILLSKNFLLLIFISNLIALPLAWWAMNSWLQNFSYHTEIDFSLFLIAVTFSLVIGIAALSYQVIKSALENPINVMRNE